MIFLKKLLLMSIFVFVLSNILKGIYFPSFLSALLFTIALSFLNAIIKPILILLSLPITLLSLGLFIFIINTGMVYLASYLVGNITIQNFFAGFIFSALISAFYMVLEWTLNSK